jgi:hypothetical protein
MKETRAVEKFKSRIVGEGVEPAGQLLANPNNWRVHPGEQQRALTSLLEKVGWVQRVMVNQRTGHVVDGHLRVHLALAKGEDTLVPVVYVDLSAAEEREVLATFDPLSAMAVADKDQLASLLQEVFESSRDLSELLGQIAKQHKVDSRDFGEREASAPYVMVPCVCPTCGYEHYVPKKEDE